MSPNLVVIPSVEAHAHALAPEMRAADATEVMAGEERTPLEALLVALARSDRPRTALINGEVAAMWGVAPVEDTVGVVWMLTGKPVDVEPYLFMRRCKEELRNLFEDGWETLVQAIDARHAKAVRWARWMGFEVLEPVPFGTQGLPFHPVRMRRHP